MERKRTTGRRAAGASKPAQRGFPYGSSARSRASQPSRSRSPVQMRPRGAGRGAVAGSKQPRSGLAGFGAARQKPARSPIAKASARLSSGRQSKQSPGRAAALTNVARGLMSQAGARRSKKGPATLAMAAAGAAGGVVLARRRKAGAASEPDPGSAETTLQVSSEPAEVAGARPEGDTPPPSAAG